MTRLKKSRGFTLIELIVVIVIIGILVALAAVAYNAVIKNSKQSAIEAKASQISKMLQAKSAADQAKWASNTTAVAYLTTDPDTSGPELSLLKSEFGATSTIDAAENDAAGYVTVSDDSVSAVIKLSDVAGGANTVSKTVPTP